MKIGGDFLGLLHYTKEAIAATKKGDVAGVMLRTFGDAREAIRQLVVSKKISEIVIHLAPFDYDHLYPIEKLYNQVIEDSEWVELMAVKHPEVKFLISPFCENNHPASKMIPLFNDIKRIAPSCLMVNSIWKGEVVPGVITEIHLPDARPVKKPKGEYMVSFDGFGGGGKGDFPDGDITTIMKRYPDARQIRYWNFPCNGKYGHDDDSPIEDRYNWPNTQMLKGYRATLTPREGKVTWPNDCLYKSFADDHDGNQSKDNKAMAIIQADRRGIKVRDSKGRVIDTMARVRPDHKNDPRGPRYYSSKYAFQLGDSAEKNTGSRLIKVDTMPLTDADLRSNKFKG